MVGSETAFVAQAAGQDKEKLPQLPRVGGHNADGKAARKDFPRPAGARDLAEHKPGPVRWPGRATVAVDLTSGPALLDKGNAGAPVQAGATPVRLGAAPADRVGEKAKAAAGGAAGIGRPSSVEVTVADRGQTEKANVDGLLVGLKRTDGGHDAAGLDVSLDYSAIADAFGGGWASRLHLVAMPACALTTPEQAECRTRQPLDSVIDPVAKTISGTLAVPGDGAAPAAKASPDQVPAMKLDSLASVAGGIAVAAESTPNGSQGSYTATDLSASGSWAQTASGAFTYSYPVTMPPAVTGAAPGVALSYNSQSVDGQTSARNSQASWIGDGWSYSPGFIERSYRPCKSAGIDKSGDQCWAGWTATISLGGRTGELVRDDNGLYHLQNDDGTRVERLTGAANGLWQGEYFKVTTTDGTAYYLGLNHAPGTTSDGATNSAWGVPVYHPNSGDPCYSAAKGAGSQCDQQPGWRFNLDFIVDPHGNVQRYDWAGESNRYAMGGGQAAAGSNGTLTAYTRGGYLTRISYGYQLADALAGREPSARVLFDTAERCVTSPDVCKPENLSGSTASNWPDVPYDLACQDGWTTTGTGSNVCRPGSPTFWTTKRLTAVRTELRAQSGWQPVDKYELTQVFSDAGGIMDPVTGKTPDKQNVGGLQSVMWLSKIQHTAQDPSTGGAEIKLDPTTFAGTEIDNRVNGTDTGAPPLYRPRIIGVNTESGTSVVVTYRDAECDRTKGRIPASADNNQMACYPAYWTPAGYAAPLADWFNKTVVKQVEVSDTTKANSPTRTTSYEYAGAAWHRDDSDLTDDQFRTWNDFRGFRTVTTTGGAAPDPISRTVVSYLQGMDGDYLANGTLRQVPKLKNSLGEELADSPWLAGLAQETDTYSQAGGTVIAKELADAPTVKSTASRKRTAWSSKKGATLATLPALEARRTEAAGFRTSALLSDGTTWRTSRSTMAFDDLARPTTATSQSDITVPTDQTCTSTTYAKPPASNPMMVAYPVRTLTVAGACGTTPSAGTILTDKRQIYDGSADPANPGAPEVLGQNGTTLGEVTATQVVKAYDQQGNPTYQTVAAQAFDSYGRVVRAVDGRGAVSQMSYTPVSGTVPTEVSATNPLGWTAKTVLAPGRSLATRTIDANGRVTDSTYDALGRRTAVWLPGNSKDAGKKADRTFGYEMHGVDQNPASRALPPSVTTSTQLENGTYRTDVTIYDGFLAPRQTQTTPANGAAGRVVSSTRYDGHGQVSKTTAAWSDPTTGPGTTLFEEDDNTVPSQTRTVYDGTGRVIASKLYAKATELWQTVTAYPGAERTDTTPPNGGTPSTVYVDAAGRTSTSVLHGGAGTGDATTRFTYDTRGLLATVADNAGNTWSYGYDLRGNRISQSDPDSGASTTAYDEFDRVTTTTDGRGKQLSYSYDLIGRLTGRFEGTDIGDPSKQLAEFTYDGLLKGLPSSEIRYVGGKGGASSSAYVNRIDSYNDRYQPKSVTTTVPAAEGKLAGDYTQAAYYTDNLGLLAGTGYGADGGLPAEKLGLTRDLMGEVVGSGTENTKLLDLANYNPLGQLLLSQYGTRGELLRTARTYDDTTGRLTTSSVKLQQADANPVSFTTYGYDQVGNLTSASELQSSGGTDQAYDTQCFRYDGLNRLAEAWTDTQGVSAPGAGQVSHCNNSDPSWVTIGGPAPYWQSFQYNLLGDRTQTVRHDVGGDTYRDVTQTSVYPGNGTTQAAKPNAATSVTSRTGQQTTTIASAMAGAGGVTLCLDVRNGLTADGTAVETTNCNGSPAQRWTRPGDGTVRALGKCMRPAAGLVGWGIELATCDGSDNQKWQDGADGALVHSASSLCLDIPGWNGNLGVQLALYYCNGANAANQHWSSSANAPSGPSYTSTLTPQYDAQGNTTSRTTIATTTLPSGVATGTTPLCLDAAGGRSDNGTAVQTWACHDGASQQWTVGQDGTVRVLGACLRPVGGNTNSGSQLELWACDSADGSQQWRIGTDGALLTAASGLCVDIPWASSTPGTRVMLYTCNQGPNQKWGPAGTQPTTGATQTFTYNAEGRTETVTNPSGVGTSTSRYLYDANGELLVQRGSEGTILYLFGGTEQLTLSPDGTTVSGKRYYPNPDGTAAVRSSSGSLTYELTNPQNTSTLQIDAATKGITRRAFDPYGSPRGPVPTSWADNRGYLGKPVDSGSGLNLLGARNYDPSLGRFLSVDPIFQAGDPNEMGGYAYSGNNPVTRSDPSGLCDWCDALVGAIDTVICLEGCATGHLPRKGEGGHEYITFDDRGPAKEFFGVSDDSISYNNARAGFGTVFLGGAIKSLVTAGVKKLAGAMSAAGPLEAAASGGGGGWFSRVTNGFKNLYKGLSRSKVDDRGIPFSERQPKPSPKAGGDGGPSAPKGSSGAAADDEGPYLSPKGKKGRKAAAESAEPSAPKGRSGGATPVGGFRPDGEVVFQGHGSYHPADGTIIVPEGTTFVVYGEFGTKLHYYDGHKVAGASPTAPSPVAVYKSGEVMPNFTLHPLGMRPDTGLPFAYRVGSEIVDEPTLLSDLIKPGAGTCHWAACQSVRRFQ
ncbi:ricin-type beta-trefoil lectin domain protein [Kitasatospora sp. NPDC096204]|uniref:ricin-type beta-trefoil lectin domain protein n=1 Tax=Kitasatospora sp. NPDC096204 TaxID=3364094 RepID=UPI00381B50A8